MTTEVTVMPKKVMARHTGPGRTEDVRRKGHEATMSSKLRFSRLIYGIWTTEDGTQVLFSRSYHPLFKRRPGEPAVPDDRHRWVHGIVQTVWFYNDGAYKNVAKRLRQIEQD